jgi:hypothetical protein
LKVSRLTLTPLKGWSGAGVTTAAADAEGAALWAVDGATDGAVEADVDAAGEVLAVGLQAAMTRTKPTAGAIDLNRDTRASSST